MPIRFRMKRGVGVHYARKGGRIVPLRPGDEITCEKAELGGAIDKFEQLDPDPPPPLPNVGLRLVARGGNWFDVINEVTNKPINDKPLRKKEAENLIRDHVSESEKAGDPEADASFGAISDEQKQREESLEGEQAKAPGE